eukprot:COSAG02_NODE_18236_length_952_cov_1.111372_3_plen_21_part_01
MLRLLALPAHGRSCASITPLA